MTWNVRKVKDATFDYATKIKKKHTVTQKGQQGWK